MPKKPQKPNLFYMLMLKIKTEEIIFNYTAVFTYSKRQSVKSILFAKKRFTELYSTVPAQD